jgi:hypothetical protein
MRLTKHRGTFNLEMSSEEVNVLCFLLQGYQQTIQILDNQVNAPTVESKLAEYLHELTVYQREAEAYDRYLETFES